MREKNAFQYFILTISIILVLLAKLRTSPLTVSHSILHSELFCYDILFGLAKAKVDH